VGNEALDKYKGGIRYDMIDRSTEEESLAPPKHMFEGTNYRYDSEGGVLKMRIRVGRRCRSDLRFEV